MAAQVAGNGPDDREVGGRRGASHLVGDPQDPSGLQVVGAHRGQSLDGEVHEEDLEVVASQEVAARDTRASARDNLVKNNSSLASSSSLVGLGGGCVMEAIKLCLRVPASETEISQKSAAVWELYRGQTRRPRAPDTGAGKADKRLLRREGEVAKEVDVVGG